MYEELSDEELLKELRPKDIKILEIIIERYNKYIDTMIKSYKLYNIEKDELLQEATIGLYKAVKSYNDGNNTKFKTYATQCIKNELNSYVRTKQRKKNRILNDAISLNSNQIENQTSEYLEMLSDKESNNPLNKVLEEESNIEFKNSIKKILSKFEYEVFKEYINGLTYIQIANKLGYSTKSVDNAIQRIKNKIGNILNN